jgi:hypothetical protein
MLQEEVRHEAVRAVVEHKLNPDETRQLVASVKEGKPLDHTVNELLSARQDVRTERWKEKREGKTRVRCTFPGCGALLVLRHNEGSKHSIETIELPSEPKPPRKPVWPLPCRRQAFSGGGWTMSEEQPQEATVTVPLGQLQACLKLVEEMRAQLEAPPGARLREQLASPETQI